MTEHSLVEKAISELSKTTKKISYQQIIDHLADDIVSSCDATKENAIDDLKSFWIYELERATCDAEITLIRAEPSFENIKKKLEDKMEVTQGNGPATAVTTTKPATPSISPKAKAKSTSTASSKLLTKEEKQQIDKMFAKLDLEKFWTLKATEKEAAKKKEKPKAVEEKIMEFARKCNYHPPSQSLILDIEDDHWESVFTTDELGELEEDHGNPLLLPVTECIADKLTELLQTVKTPKDVYKYAQKIVHDPIDDPLLVWLTMTLMSVSLLCMKHADVKEGYLESDKQYQMWGFINTVFIGSPITAYSKEKSSKANATASNSKRKLSAVEEVQRKAMGRKMDAIYISGGKELGCMEVVSEADQTKEWKDGMVKMPVVM
ncbi:hypothetical protein BDB00DRAFT_880667 [Zychaea mexicana]|uniref:uncharacterized protein n=1 Tax=Zychaea mexicana TaxID=64656 RepID=UPI0022FE753D|nr:uncharacterized protein BDB00DRAFT_880667 [Zychaea mexicana]KAI9466416.1 hypothetical protein BDB00DRAFT_880667 [Zychaea mexicana]